MTAKAASAPGLGVSLASAWYPEQSRLLLKGYWGIKTGELKAAVSCGGTTVVMVVVVVTLGGTPVVVVVTFGRSLGALNDSCCPVLLAVPRYFTISFVKLAISCLLVNGLSLFCANV